ASGAEAMRFGELVRAAQPPVDPALRPQAPASVALPVAGEASIQSSEVPTLASAPVSLITSIQTLPSQGVTIQAPAANDSEPMAQAVAEMEALVQQAESLPTQTQAEPESVPLPVDE